MTAPFLLFSLVGLGIFYLQNLLFFPVEWDISELENGTYEIMASMQVFMEEDCRENIIAAGQTIKEVAVRD